MTAETKNCQNCKQNFTIESDDFDFYKKIDVPPPTFCTECRIQRRLTWRNERTLHKRNCDLCNKSILTIYSSDKPRKVYCTQCWYSDKWSPLNYGREYDFNKPFFTQYDELLESVPFLNLSLTSVENSDYCNYSLNLKNCYLLFGSWECENSGYSQRVVRVKDAFDNLWLTQGELIYNSTYCTECNNISFSFDSHGCSDSKFLIHCRGCSNCFGCVNLRNKSYCIFDEQYSKEDYLEKMRSFDLGSFKNIQEAQSKFNQSITSSIRPANIFRNTVGSSGDLLRNCRNCKNCFLSNEGEDSAYSRLIEKNFKDCYDIWIAMENVEKCYELVAGGANDHGSKFGVTLYQGCFDLSYCYTCISSNNSFACASLRSKQYCILNKQYTKEEYESLVPKIIKHMNDMPYVDKKGRTYRYGEFFPPELSPFAYNETIAQEYFPLTKDQAEAQGYRWKDPDTKEYTITVKPESLPDHVKDTTDDILKETIGCEHKGTCTHQCTTAFRIIPEELSFYRRMNLPLPRLCPNCRHYERLAQRNPLKLWHRQCMCDKNNHNHQGNCPNEFETSYSPERKEIVYCESCYSAEVV